MYLTGFPLREGDWSAVGPHPHIITGRHSELVNGVFLIRGAPPQRALQGLALVHHTGEGRGGEQKMEGKFVEQIVLQWKLLTDTLRCWAWHSLLLSEHTRMQITCHKQTNWGVGAGNEVKGHSNCSWLSEEQTSLQSSSHLFSEVLESWTWIMNLNHGLGSWT